MITYDELDNFIFSNYAIQEKIVNVIDDYGRQIVIESLPQLMSFHRCTIKVQSMEKYNESFYKRCLELKLKFKHPGPVTCHVFRAFENSQSFGMHTDPDDVFLYVVEGSKTIEIDGTLNELNPGDSLFIKAGTPHKAHNIQASLMLSFGLEKFMIDKVNNELDVLFKNY